MNPALSHSKKTGTTRLIVALDTPDYEKARGLAATLGDSVDAIKLGMELVYGTGMEKARELAALYPAFLDLKLYDIPNTVAQGIRSLAPLAPRLLTIHASGGAEMIRAAKKALEISFPDKATRPILLAVTVLTSFDARGLKEIGCSNSPLKQTLLLGKLAMDAGADGLVCSAHEISALRRALGRECILVVPGIRPAGTAYNDQKRIMTPKEAAEAGADWIVVGRPITQAPSPLEAARAIKAELSEMAGQTG